MITSSHCRMCTQRLSFCVDRGFSKFFHVVLAIHQIYHLATQLCWCTNMKMQVLEWFSVFTGPNYFGLRLPNSKV